VAAQLGYCGLDRQRRPLRGDEIRECWEAIDVAGAAAPARPTLGPAAGWALEPGDDRTPVRLRDFIEVRAESARDPGRKAKETPTPESTPMLGDSLAAPGLPSAGEPRWNLWGDAEA
jgi:hypothetical protein